MALSLAFGPGTGLALREQLMAFPAVQNHHLLPGVRGDLPAKLGRHAEAAVEVERAASLTRNERERTLALNRAACDQPVRTGGATPTARRPRRSGRATR